MRGVRHDAIRDLLRSQGHLLSLIAVIFGVYLLQEVRGAEWYDRYLAVPGQLAEAWRLLLDGECSMPQLYSFSTLLSCAFFHGGPDHLIYNMLFLWIFAALAVELLGRRWMWIIFVVTALCASAFHALLNARDFVPMLGASGAVMGFEGAYLGLAMRWRLPDPHIWPMSRPVPPGRLALVGVVGVVLDFMSLMEQAESFVAYGAHLGGFVSGLVLASLFAPRPSCATRA